jgi:hypothetical protein
VCVRALCCVCVRTLSGKLITDFFFFSLTRLSCHFSIIERERERERERNTVSFVQHDINITTHQVGNSAIHNAMLCLLQCHSPRK